MKSFFIMPNDEKRKSLSLAEEIISYFEKKGLRVTTDIQEKDIDCVISIGGDGTLIRASKEALKIDAPVIGINSGRLGFLAEIEEFDLYDRLDDLIKDNYYIENRMRLESKVIRDNGDYIVNTALNDVVILKDRVSGILTISIYVNEMHINDFNGDGVIISSPTGSTGYSLSAGGPIVDPRGKIIIITPINPHSLNTRSIVLSGDSIIGIKIKSRKDRYFNKGIVSLDGEMETAMTESDRLEIKASSKETKIIRLNKDSFFKIIRNKMRDA